MSEQPYTVFTAMTDIVAAPGKALDEIKNHTAWLWWPLLINVGLAVAATVYYAYWVDMEWLIDDTIANLPPGTDPAAADSVRSFMGPSKTAILAPSQSSLSPLLSTRCRRCGCTWSTRLRLTRILLSGSGFHSLPGPDLSV